MLRLGLTGGIGSGKSTVSRMLQARGAGLIDADALARASTAAGGAAIAAISSAFGPQLIDSTGALDRDRMRALAFADPTARQALESIVHPIVGQEIQQRAQACNSACLVFDIPLLVESPRWRAQLDRVMVIDCTPATQYRRVRARNGWDDDTIAAVLRQQASRNKRLAAADLVIFNDEDDLEALEEQVRPLALRFGL